MKPPFDIAADLDTPVSAFRKLAPFKPRFLLESVEGGERLARYSFIGFGDGLEVRLDAQGLRLGNEPAIPREAVTRHLLLSTLRRALAQAPAPGRDLPGVALPGGLVGVGGFDLVRRFEKVPVRGPAADGTPEAAYFAPRSLFVFDHLTRRAALLHDGTPEEQRALRAEIVAALRGGLSMPVRTSPRHGPPISSFTPNEFMVGVEKTQAYIRAGDVYQLVLSNRFSGECEVDPFEVYRALRLLNPSPYLYYLDFDDFAVVGSSPEALVKLEGRAASLRPIAGTRPRGHDADADLAYEKALLADPKEAAEHVMLVDLARNDLGRVAMAGTVKVDPYRIIERYSHVMHIVSGVRGMLAPGCDAFDLFAATFPAGTVVGAPKVRAVQLIEELEPVDRGLYAGTVGYFGRRGDMDQAIAIRTLMFLKNQGRYAYQAGAGIVADSVPEMEHREVMAKSAALEAALTLAEGGL